MPQDNWQEVFGAIREKVWRKYMFIDFVCFKDLPEIHSQNASVYYVFLYPFHF